MSRYSRHGGETKVYVGNLGTGAGKGELERAFGYYGPLRTVWIARNPPGFAFVEFDDPRDAEDAVRGLDGKVICGTRVRVELSTGMPRRSRYDRPPTRRPFDPNDRCYECGEKGHYAYDCHRYSRRRRSRFHRLIQSVTTLYDFMNLLANATLSILLDRLDLLDLGSKEGRPANLQGLVLALAEGGILVPTLAAGAEAGGRGPSPLAALAPVLRGGPGLAHPEGPGLDHDPDLALALPLIRGADPALLGDPGLDLQPGAFANLKHHLRNKVTVALLLKPLAEARAQIESVTEIWRPFPEKIPAPDGFSQSLPFCQRKLPLLPWQFEKVVPLDLIRNQFAVCVVTSVSLFQVEEVVLDQRVGVPTGT
ncbi:hypothetical protein Q7C36_001409 [Tachysurus vachellii]|uniref:Serine/arginine-rich splicing factor 7 n=1 Tax=Tachysurus vachellii TaxID=175792 RepID=A0AA88T9Z6_TACVA|nr:hypothetical protein Q7C36_001409 [Tachysurus vachellii]